MTRCSRGSRAACNSRPAPPTSSLASAAKKFVVVCEATDLAGATVVAERMRVALKALQFSTPKGPLSVTSSFGVALLLTDDADGHATLEHADKQLYKAKQQGRDRVVAG